MITPSFGLTATERVLPKLALDFTTASLDSRITFTRSLNTATRVNSSGYIELVNADTPRFDYDPVTLACKGLLIEETKINQFINSNTPSSWTSTNASFGVTPIESPDGTNNCYKLTEDTNTGNHFTRSGSISYVSGTTYTFSIYAKSTERYLQLTFSSTAFGGSSINNGAVFDLVNGQVSTTGSGLTTAKIENAGDGFYRCSITKAATTTVASAATAAIYLRNGTALDLTGYQGDGTSGVYLFGGQVEATAFTTSYIPTDATAGGITRNADVVTMTGTNFSSWYNQSEGAYAVEFYRNVTGTRYVLSSYTAAGDRLGLNTGNTSLVWTSRVSSSTNASTITIGSTLGLYRAAVAYKVSDMAAAVNGGASIAASPQPSSIYAATNMYLGQLGDGTGFLNGCISKINYWPQRIINSEIQAFSK